MEKRRRIVLFGNSIILGTVGASLHRSLQYDVITMPPSKPEDLNSLAPDIVLFDLEGSRPETAFRMLESCPSLTLVGISPDNNIVKVWSSRQLRELSTQDLMGVIDGQSNVPAEIHEGGANDRRYG
jgi:hypothetical protein